ncbi:MAG: hypothetical protein LIO93_10630 [Bacteroidales bacterium]|nr:hypothetical protein [Bacteroidales bacterium]
MKLKIFKQNTTQERVTISPSDNSTLTQAAMGEHVLALSFILSEKIDFEINDYVNFEGNTYTLIEKPDPAMKSNQEWVYDLKFHGIEAELKRALVLNGEDPVFPLTGKVAEHLALIATNINRIKKTSDWKASYVPGTEDTDPPASNENIVISYNGTSCYDALTQLATQLETEWWVDGKTIVLGPCKFGTPITMGYKKGLVNLNRNDHENLKFFTRLYPIGGTRNIDPKPVQEGGYGFKRLQLPEVNGKRPTFIDLETSKQFGIIEHFEEAAFSGIYPHKTGTIQDTDDKPSEEEGREETDYYFTDNSLGFDPDEYKIDGLEMRIVFQDSQELNGYDFEVVYDNQQFRIINSYPEGFGQLPGGNMIPHIGDKYILYNIKMPAELCKEAEKEFEKTVNEYIQKHSIDKSVYQGETDYIEISKLIEGGLQFRIGQRVNLEVSPGDVRSSRITAISKNVNIPAKMALTFSDVIAKGKIESLQQEVEETMNFARSYTLPDVVKSWEKTPPSDYNLFSSLKSVREFLSKKNKDTAEEEITFRKGVKLGKFDYGPLGTGGAILIDEDGNSHAEFDFLDVRRKATFTELEIKELKHIGGELILSPASMVCDRVEEIEIEVKGEKQAVYRCYFSTTGPDGEKIMNQFEMNDQAICQSFNVENKGAEGRYYWRLVMGTGENYIDLLKKDCKGTDIPLPGDRIVQLGNRTNPARQNAQILSAYGQDAPSFKQYTGINSYSLEDKCLTAFTSKGNRITANYTLPNGDDVQSKVEMLDGYIRSEVSSIKKDFLGYDSYLQNSYFNNNLRGWKTNGDIMLVRLGNKMIWAGDNLYSHKRTYVGIINDGQRSVLFISNSSLKQLNEDYETHPLFEKEERGDEGNKTTLFAPKIFHIGFNYKCIKGGKLNVSFSDVIHKEEFHDFDTLEVKDHTIVATTEEEGYQQFSYSGYWNGQGDFNLSFDGEIYIYNLRLTEDKLEYVEQKFSTRITQTDKKIESLADVKKEMPNGDIQYLGGSIVQSAESYEIKYVDTTNEEINKSSALRITSGGLSFVTYENGTPNNTAPLVTQTDIESGNIKIKAENIDFQGLVKINDKVTFREDGSLEAAGATITGKFETSQEGERVVIDSNPEDFRKIKLVTSYNKVVGSFEFYDTGPRITGRVRVSEMRKDDLYMTSICDLNPYGLFVSAPGNYLDITIGSFSLISLGKLPTSSSELPPATLWRDGDLVKITPLKD